MPVLLVVASRIRRHLPFFLFGAAALALLLPVLVHRWVPTVEADISLGEMVNRAKVSTVLAWWFAIAGVGLLLHRARFDGRAPRQLGIVTAVAALLAAGLLLPIYDDFTRGQAHQYYEHADHVRRTSTIQLDDLQDREGPMYAYDKMQLDARVGSVTTEALAATRGDVWLVGFVVYGPRWEGFEPPEVWGEGVVCHDEAHLDGFQAHTPSYMLWTRCVIQETGLIELHAGANNPEPREYGLSISMLPTLHHGFTETLDERAATLAGMVGALSGAAYLVHWRRGATRSAR